MILQVTVNKQGLHVNGIVYFCKRCNLAFKLVCMCSFYVFGAVVWGFFFNILYHKVAMLSSCHNQ